MLSYSLTWIETLPLFYILQSPKTFPLHIQTLSHEVLKTVKLTWSFEQPITFNQRWYHCKTPISSSTPNFSGLNLEIVSQIFFVHSLCLDFRLS